MPAAAAAMAAIPHGHTVCGVPRPGVVQAWQRPFPSSRCTSSNRRTTSGMAARAVAKRTQSPSTAATPSSVALNETSELCEQYRLIERIESQGVIEMLISPNVLTWKILLC